MSELIFRHMNVIQQENAREGSNDWQLTRMRLDGSGYRSPVIEGYCSRQSVKAGEVLDVFVSTRPAAKFKIEIFRTGFYGGRGARKLDELGPFDGKEQPTPGIGEKRLRECQWEKCTSITIPADWVSGVYLGRLTTLPPTPEYRALTGHDRMPALLPWEDVDTWLTAAWPAARALLVRVDAIIAMRRPERVAT